METQKIVHAAGRNTGRVVTLRQLVVEAIQQEDVTHFVFADETSANLTYCRRYGRVPQGRRVDHVVPLYGGPNVTFIVARTLDGPGSC